jgi:hypothetical protein
MLPSDRRSGRDLPRAPLSPPETAVW